MEVGTKQVSDTDRAIGCRIRARRIALRISQTALGERLGVTFQQVQKYEKGTNRISAGRLQKIAEVLEVPLTTLVGDGVSTDALGDRVMRVLSHPGALDLLEDWLILEPELRRKILDLITTLARSDQGQASA